MKQQFIKADSINTKQWDELVEHSPTATFFQTRHCYEFFSSLSFMEAFVFGVNEDDELKGIIVGYIPKDGGRVNQFLSRRAIITGGALLAEDISDEAIVSLLNGTRQSLKKKAIYIETRNLNDYSQYKDKFSKCGFKYVAHLNFHVDCSDEKMMTKNISSSKVRQIKKSLKSGTEVVEAKTEAEVVQFYSVLLELYTTKVKTPLFPVEFFLSFFRNNIGKYFLVKNEGNVIGGIMSPVLDNRVIYEWFVAGIDKGETKSLYPSIVATWAAMDYATKNSVSKFDFMGAGKPNEEYGVRDFKAKFGGELVEHGRFLCITNPLLYYIGKFGVKLLKKI